VGVTVILIVGPTEGAGDLEGLLVVGTEGDLVGLKEGEADEDITVGVEVELLLLLFGDRERELADWLGEEEGEEVPKLG
jgi:hypothetical protein